MGILGHHLSKRNAEERRNQLKEMIFPLRRFHTQEGGIGPNLGEAPKVLTAMKNL